MTCPCKDCEFRHLECHAECEPYKMWREEKKARVEESLLKSKPTEFLIDQIKKQKRYTHNHKRK